MELVIKLDVENEIYVCDGKPGCGSGRQNTVFL